MLVWVSYDVAVLYQLEDPAQINSSALRKQTCQPVTSISFIKDEATDVVPIVLLRVEEALIPLSVICKKLDHQSERGPR